MSVEIRRTEPSDAAALKEVYRGQSAYTGTLQLPHPSLAMWQKRLAETPDNVHSWVALVEAEVVGNLGLTVAVNPRRRHVASLGMAVVDDVQGQGVGSALMQTATNLADNWLNLKRLELTVYVDNERAIGLYKKFGFQVEGEAKAFAFRDGEYADAYYMARTR